MSTDLALDRFAVDCLVRAGAVLEHVGYGLVHVLLPEEVAPDFGTDELLLAFDAEVAAETPGAVFLTYGSPLLDVLVDLALDFGRYTALWRPGPVAVPRNLEHRIAENLEFRRCRAPRLAEHRVLEHVYYGFYFRCAFRSFERAEEVNGVVVEGSSGRVEEDFRRHWQHVVPAAEPDQELPRSGVLPLRELYGRACRALEEVVRRRAGALFPGARVLRDRELARIDRYYRDNEALLERRLAAAESQARRERVREQLNALRAEWRRRLQDAAARYDVEVEAVLDHVVAYHVPLVHAVVEVQHRERAYRHTVWYNPLAARVELPACPLCGVPTRVLEPCGDVLACPGHS